MTTGISRRTFIGSSVALGLVSGLRHVLPSYARPRLEPSATFGTSKGVSMVELSIGDVGISIGGRPSIATAINGTVPGPLLRFREGDDAVVRVSNHLKHDTSIHWHGIILPFNMDGVPGVSFPGIKPGETFEYRFPVRQSGTYWYHSHSGLQEQTGVYGPLVIDPANGDRHDVDRDFVIVLGDWTFANPHAVLNKLRKSAGYYNYNKPTLVGLVRDARERGLGAVLRDRARWRRMRMDPTDIADVTGSTYTYLVNGMAPDDNWTGLFKPGERVRLRFINAGAGTFFDVRIPGLPMTVVQADGQDVQPVTVDEFRIALAETYDVIVEPGDDRAYMIFAEAMDRSGYASGTLAPREGMRGEIPARRQPRVRSMADMGMNHDMPGMDTNTIDSSGVNPEIQAMNREAPVMDHTMADMDHSDHGMTTDVMLAPPGSLPATKPHGSDTHGPGNSAAPMHTRSRLHEPGIGLGNDDRRVLVYTDLRSLSLPYDERPPTREIELHLTGNMERYMWSFDGKEYSKSPDPIEIGLDERVRLTLVNDTMMEHPIHLHGMWMLLENGTDEFLPRKHTVNVKPAERLSVVVAPDTLGPWAMHCHILYHMDMGMFRVVEVVGDAPADVAEARP